MYFLEKMHWQANVIEPKQLSSFLTHFCTQRIWCLITASLLASGVSAVPERFSDSVDLNSFIALSFLAFIMFLFKIVNKV